jgi:hypothetical protein
LIEPRPNMGPSFLSLAFFLLSLPPPIAQHLQPKATVMDWYKIHRYFLLLCPYFFIIHSYQEAICIITVSNSKQNALSASFSCTTELCKLLTVRCENTTADLHIFIPVAHTNDGTAIEH